MNELPGYYAILIPQVRYDKNLKPMEKLMYAEITALSNKNGFCHASNNYFAELYDCDKSTISRYISDLEKNGYVKVEVIRDSNNTVTERKIFISHDILIKPIDEKINSPLDKKINSPIDEKVKENITRMNTTSLNNIPTEKKSDLNTLKDSWYQTYFSIYNSYPDSNLDSSAKVTFWKSITKQLKTALKDKDLNSCLKAIEYAKTEKWIIDRGFALATILCDATIQKALTNAPHVNNFQNQLPGNFEDRSF